MAPPAGQIESTKSLLCGFEANPDQCRAEATLPADKMVVYGVFPADVPPPVLGITLSTSVKFDRSLSVGATSDTAAITLAGSAAGLIPQPGAKGENSAGASVNVLRTDHRVSAVVDADRLLDRAIGHESGLDLLPRLRKVYGSVTIGDPRKAGTLIGPLYGSAILTTLRLKQAAGPLSPDDLAALEQYLGRPDEGYKCLAYFQLRAVWRTASRRLGLIGTSSRSSASVSLISGIRVGLPA